MSIGTKPIKQIRAASAIATASVTELITAANNSKGAKSLDFANATDSTVQIMLGEAGSEVAFLNIGAGFGVAGPIHVPEGVRISVKALGSDTTSGELTGNFYI